VFDTLPIHNHYVRLLCETGLPGLALYLAFFVWALAQGRRLPAETDPFLAAVSVALTAALVGIMVYWLDDIFYGVLIRSHTWLLVALLLVVRHIAGREVARARAEAA
jgi:O-antigen ligase